MENLELRTYIYIINQIKLLLKLCFSIFLHHIHWCNKEYNINLYSVQGIIVFIIHMSINQYHE